MIVTVELTGIRWTSIDFSTGLSLNSSMHSGRPDFGWPLE